MNSFNFINRVVGTTGDLKHFSEIVNYFNDNKAEMINTHPELLHKISIQSCTKEYMSVNDSKQRWESNYSRLRSDKTYYKSLIYFYIKKSQWIHKSVDFIFGRK